MKSEPIQDWLPKGNLTDESVSSDSSRIQTNTGNDIAKQNNDRHCDGATRYSSYSKKFSTSILILFRSVYFVQINK